MKRRAAIRNLILAAAASFFRRALIGNPRDEGQDDYIIRSDVRLVLLDVSVKDRNGRLVAGLSKDNFRVLENGALQPITVFANEDLPVTVGILVDESHSMAPKRADVLSAAETFIAESNQRDEIFVLNFNDTVRRGLPADLLFSDDIGQLRSALNRAIPEGRTALHDALLGGLEQLKLGSRDKKALVVISDGGDNASRHSRTDVLDRLERSGATVYTIGLFDAGDPDRDPGILKQIAWISGGESCFPKNTAAMVGVCRGIARDIRTRYTIGYVPPASNGGSLRRVRVSVSTALHARLTARARTSYQYEETENQGKR